MVFSMCFHSAWTQPHTVNILDSNGHLIGELPILNYCHISGGEESRADQVPVLKHFLDPIFHKRHINVNTQFCDIKLSSSIGIRIAGHLESNFLISNSLFILNFSFRLSQDIWWIQVCGRKGRYS
jgi:hypothetical protein